MGCLFTSEYQSNASRHIGYMSRMSGQAPLYFADDWRLVCDSTRRSAYVSTCVLPPTLSSYGDRTSAAAAPRLWNSLPVQLRNPDITYGLFRRQLKGHLFREALTRRSVTSDMRRHRKTLTYLLTDISSGRVACIPHEVYATDRLNPWNNAGIRNVPVPWAGNEMGEAKVFFKVENGGVFFCKKGGK